MTPLHATPHHAAAMALVHAAAFPPGDRWGPEAIALQLGLPGAFGFLLPVAEGGGFILARVAADEAEVLTLAVAPNTQGRGRGHKLLTAAMDHARSHGAASMFLEVSPGNAAALALYNSAGFVPVGRRPRYYPGGGDALVLRRPLSPGAAAAGASRPPGG